MSRTQRAFRPAVVGLEDRIALSTGVGFAQSGRDPQSLAAISGPSTVPVVGADEPFVSANDWMAQHRQYVARARQGGNPVVVLGDSISFLWGDPHRKVPRDEVLKPVGTTAWRATLGADRAANFGIVGDSTQNLLWRVEHGELAGHPKVAVVLIGINNVLLGDTADETAAGIAAVVQAVRAASPTTHVLLLGVLPPFSDPNDPLRVVVRAVNSRIAGLADGQVTYLDVGPAFVNPDGTNKFGLIGAGGIHPTVQGYDTLSATLQPVIASLLAQPHAAGRHARAR